MTNFHTASACSPTRSMLFSGTDNHIAGLGMRLMPYPMLGFLQANCSKAKWQNSCAHSVTTSKTNQAMRVT